MVEKTNLRDPPTPRNPAGSSGANRDPLRPVGPTNHTPVVEDEHDCCVDRWAAHTAKRARKREVGSPVSRRLLDAIDAVGLEGRSVLDVGCGSGDLALATLARGADRTTGIDLGAGAIEEA